MVAAPGIVGFLVQTADFIARFDDVVFDRKTGVVEAGAHGAARAVELIDGAHGLGLDRFFRDGLESLVLAHVLGHHFGLV